MHDVFPDAELIVISKNDTSTMEAGETGVARFSTVGWWSLPQRTVAYTAQLLQRTVADRPDLIVVAHANFAPLAHLVKKIFGIRFVVIGYGIDVWHLNSAAVGRALRAADQLFAISRFTQERMAANIDRPTEVIELLPCTFSEIDYQIRPKPRFLLKRYGLGAEQPVILTIARLAGAERYKGYDQVLRALPAVRRVIPNVRYILGGRGADRPRIVSLIRELGLEESVALAGYIPEHELCAHYNLCDAFAMPSKGEGFGIVFLEALACGKPVIAGNKDGSVDPVGNGEFGALVDPDSVEEISTALIGVISKTHPLKILQQPETLRNGAIEAFGYRRFSARVHHLFGRFVDADSEGVMARN